MLIIIKLSKPETDCRRKKGLLADGHRDANAHRGKVKKAGSAAFSLRIVEEESPHSLQG
jgi:hypothetical protein